MKRSHREEDIKITYGNPPPSPQQIKPSFIGHQLIAAKAKLLADELAARRSQTVATSVRKYDVVEETDEDNNINSNSSSNNNLTESQAAAISQAFSKHDNNSLITSNNSTSNNNNNNNNSSESSSTSLIKNGISSFGKVLYRVKIVEKGVLGMTCKQYEMQRTVITHINQNSLSDKHGLQVDDIVCVPDSNGKDDLVE